MTAPSSVSEFAVGLAERYHAALHDLDGNTTAAGRIIPQSPNVFLKVYTQPVIASEAKQSQLCDDEIASLLRSSQ
jgi:hypothetical protein